MKCIMVSRILFNMHLYVAARPLLCLTRRASSTTAFFLAWQLEIDVGTCIDWSQRKTYSSEPAAN